MPEGVYECGCALTGIEQFYEVEVTFSPDNFRPLLLFVSVPPCPVHTVPRLLARPRGGVDLELALTHPSDFLSFITCFLAPYSTATRHAKPRHAPRPRRFPDVTL